MTGMQLSDLLERASADVRPVDLADRSWSRAQAIRTRRRAAWSGAVAAVAAGALVITVVNTSRDSARQRTVPGQTTTTAADFFPVTVTAADGSALIQAPTAAQIPALPQAVIPGLPADGVLGWSGTPPTLASVVADRGPATIVALASYTAGTTTRPAVLLSWSRDEAPKWATFDLNLQTENGSTIGNRAISVGGDGAIFLQPDAAVVVNPATGTTRAIRMPVDPNTAGEHLVDGGYAGDGTIVVRSHSFAWRVDPISGKVSRIASDAYPADARLVEQDGQESIVRYRDSGVIFGSTVVSVPSGGMVGDSASNAVWVASGSWVDPAQLRAPVEGVNSLIVVDLRTGDRRRVLVADRGSEQGWLKASIRAVGFFDNMALFTYQHSTGTWLLGFDVTDGTVFRVATVTSQIQNLTLEPGLDPLQPTPTQS